MNSSAYAPGEVALMQKIRAQWGPAIRAAIAGTPIRESFLAALSANETSGDASKTRFEAAELGQFALVLAGRKASYQGLTNDVLVPRLQSAATVGSVVPSLAKAAAWLVDICTSFGPTQIMGWQTLKTSHPLADLQSIGPHFGFATKLLCDFNRQCDLQLPVREEGWRDLFICWNTGSPHGATTDPQYVPNGLTRMAIYEALP